MASSNVEIASTSKNNPDLPRESSVCSISTIIADLQHSDPSRNLVSMSMDDLLKNIYSDGQTHNQPQPENPIMPASIPTQDTFPLPKDLSTRSVEEVWKEIVAGGGDQRREPATDHEITLEDFLSKAGAVHQEDVRRVPVISEAGGYGVDSTLNNQFQIPPQQLEGAPVGYASGIDGRMVGVGRGKRRAVEEPVDKATQQKQRRMIKNRESAARSRERKQAYTLELESLVTQLEEENARLLREEDFCMYLSLNHHPFRSSEESNSKCRLSTSRNGLSSSRRNSFRSARSGGHHSAFLQEQILFSGSGYALNLWRDGMSVLIYSC